MRQGPGRKAVAVNISDVAAMGGVPRYILVSLALPGGVSRRSLKALYGGIMNMAGEYGIALLGGDTNGSDRFAIDVSILGEVQGRCPITRSGARRGDAIMITGPVRNGRKEHLEDRKSVV